jgi:hypothetical protein
MRKSFVVPGTCSRISAFRMPPNDRPGCYALNQLLDERKLAQTEPARVLGVSRLGAAALRNYNLAGFSVERLTRLLAAVDEER